jgi:glycosyltransferase involved in cell wall biosynthesis
MMPHISIIIPCHNTDSADALVAQLKNIKGFEVILSIGESRAKAMNASAKRAKGDFLWFLHSDSTLLLNLIQEVRTKILNEQAIYYSPFKFKEKNWFLKLTEWGVYLRCKIFKIPFGDQGFLMHKTLFKNLGTYNEDAPFGEDHLLIQVARKKNVEIASFKNPLFTSARKYLKQGWLTTTLKHQYLFYKQWHAFKKGNFS